jgi:DNA polymerase-3 subunit delta'
MEWPVEGVATQVLKHALSQNRLAHAYLFSGPEGGGQIETAHMFAQAILCEQKADKPCGECLACRKFQNGNNSNFIEIIPDGQSIKIQQIREIQKQLALKAVDAEYKVYIIQQADTMTTEAANSLLKTLEEPVSPVIALLITYRMSAILPTVVSRCQIVPFQALSLDSIKHRLIQDGIEMDKAHFLSKIIGNYGDAKHWAASEWFAECTTVVLQLTEDLAYDKGNPLLTIQDKLIKSNPDTRDLEFFLDCLAWWFRDLRQIKLGLIDDIAYKNYEMRLREQAKCYNSNRLSDIVGYVLEFKKRLHNHVNVQLGLEQLIFRIQEVKYVYRSGNSV